MTWMGRDNITYFIVMSYETPYASPPFHCTVCVYIPLAGGVAVSPSVCPQYLCGSGGNPALLANVVRCRPRTTGLHGHRGGIWKQGDTRLAATSRFSQLSPFSPLPGDCLAPRATNYVIRGAQSGVHSHRFLHAHRSADHHG